MMLHITGLWQYHHPVPSEPSRSRNAGAILAPPPPEAYSTPINAGNHLAGNRFEAQWFSAHFDMLFPHFHIENLLSGIAVYEKRNFSNQLVAVDHQHFVVWNVITTLIVMRHPSKLNGRLVFQCEPFIAVYRMQQPYLMRVPFPFPLPPLVEENDDVEGIRWNIQNYSLQM